MDVKNEKMLSIIILKRWKEGKKKNLYTFGLIFERGIVIRHEDKDTLTSKRPGLHLISGHCIVLITKPLCYGAPTVYI